MFINRLSLKNFKCFKEVDLEFPKITLLTGENSSGKSSIIYGILAPFQSVQPVGDSFPLNLSFNGKYVRMGDFESVVFNHDLRTKIELQLTLTHNRYGKASYSTSWQGIKEKYKPTLSHAKADGFIYSFTVDQDEKQEYSIRFFPDKGENKSSISKQKKIGDFLDISFFDDLEQELERQFTTDQILLDTEINSSFNYISPFRFPPDRTYYQSDINNRLDSFGSGYIDQILKWQNETNEIFQELVTILNNLSVVNDLRSSRLSGGRFEVQVKPKKNSSWESIADVGFGISQFLPIVVADLQLLWNATLIVSQPEIHLHPSVQANLGNYFVNQINTKNRQYILETHSEYLLNRIRLLIVQGELKTEDIAIYYFENSAEQGSITHQIEFTKDGQILNAPQGFFETYMIDTMDIAIHA